MDAGDNSNSENLGNNNSRDRAQNSSVSRPMIRAFAIYFREYMNDPQNEVPINQRLRYHVSQLPYAPVCEPTPKLNKTRQLDLA